MIRAIKTCRLGHVYATIRPSKYVGKAIYPPECPKCGRAVKA